MCPTAYGDTHAPVLREGSCAEAGMKPEAAEALDKLLTEWAAESGEPFGVALARNGVVYLHKATRHARWRTDDDGDADVDGVHL